VKKAIGILALTVVAACVAASTAVARESAGGDARTSKRFRVDVPRGIRLDAGPQTMAPHSPASPETTWLAVYTLDSGANCVSEGWTSADRTAQTGDYFHVDDFAGLGGGDFGRLVPRLVQVPRISVILLILATIG
jgi:hypothetical protein